MTVCQFPSILTCFFHCNRSSCVCCNHYFSSRISVCWILKLTHPSFLGLFTIFFRTVFLFDMTFLTFFIVFQIRFPVFLLLTKIALIDMSNLSGTVLVILSILSVSCYNIYGSPGNKGNRSLAYPSSSGMRQKNPGRTYDMLSISFIYL